MNRTPAHLTNRPSVIVADDDPGILEQVQALLRDEFEILKAVGDGRSLVDAAEILSPDVVIADITMPGTDGLQATRELGRRCPGIPVVILSVHDEAAYLEAAQKVGALAYVVKRQATYDLIPAIRSVLTGKRFVSPAVQEGI